MDRDNEALNRRMAETAAASGQSEASSDDDTSAVREGVTRAIDPDAIELRADRAVVEDDTARLPADFGGFDADRDLAKPPELPESVDVTTVAPDGTTVPDGTSRPTDPLGQTIGGGRSVSDSVMSGLGGLGGDALGRDLDFDLTSPGTQGQDFRETTGDPSVDRAISEHDGSTISAAPIDPETGLVTGRDRDLDPPEPPRGRHEDPTYDGEHEHAPMMSGRSEDPTDPSRGDDIVGPGYAMENPDGAGMGESVTNLERVMTMQGSQVQPSNNPDDPAAGGESTDNWIPPADLETMPAQDGETADTALTSAATLGSSPLTNPTDPVLGDDGIIHGGTYGGSGGSGGGGTLDSMTAMSAGDGSASVEDTSALGGEGNANLPLTAEPAPVGAGGTEMKIDANNVSVDMGDAAALALGSPDAALGGETSAPGEQEGPPPMGEEGPLPGEDS